MGVLATGEQPWPRREASAGDASDGAALSRSSRSRSDLESHAEGTPERDAGVGPGVRWPVGEEQFVRGREERSVALATPRQTWVQRESVGGVDRAAQLLDSQG